jgi:hypothetical protein
LFLGFRAALAGAAGDEVFEQVAQSAAEPAAFIDAAGERNSRARPRPARDALDDDRRAVAQDGDDFVFLVDQPGLLGAVADHLGLGADQFAVGSGLSGGRIGQCGD